jgi:Tol biopolymer transport system component
MEEKKKRLTISDGLDDGPDYSSDGKYIYFNSYRTGHMQIWRMQSDGTNQEQLTFDDNSNWHIHHLITNGSYLFHTCLMRAKSLVWQACSIKIDEYSHKTNPVITPVFYGGQGTFNVPSWSSDSRKVAFVSYSIK